MAKRKKNEKSLSESEIHQFVGSTELRLADTTNWSILSDIGESFLDDYGKFCAHNLQKFKVPKNPSPECFHSIFGEPRKDHAFHYNWDWGINLTEPNVTKTIANLFDLGPTEIRRKRILAFLNALGVNSDTVKSLTCRELDETEIHAEHLADEAKDKKHRNKRIDLQVWLPTDAGTIAIVIEAKFGHDITTGQLSAYFSSTQNDRKLGDAKHEFILLAEDEDAKKGLQAQQNKIWRYVEWTEFWHRFEKARPAGDNPNINYFMNALWQKLQYPRKA